MIFIKIFSSNFFFSLRYNYQDDARRDVYRRGDEFEMNDVKLKKKIFCFHSLPKYEAIYLIISTYLMLNLSFFAHNFHFVRPGSKFGKAGRLRCAFQLKKNLTNKIFGYCEMRTFRKHFVYGT